MPRQCWSDSARMTVDPGHRAGSWRTRESNTAARCGLLSKGILRVSGAVGYLMPRR